jgi:hypothetical protein
VLGVKAWTNARRFVEITGAMMAWINEIARRGPRKPGGQTAFTRDYVSWEDASRPRMTNLGCGRRIHPAWGNVDIAPPRPEVIRCDLSRGIPFESDSFFVEAVKPA